MSDNARLQAICNKTYKEQAVWFLNCFWLDFAEKEAERLWQYVEKNAELDLENHSNGSGLDEMKAHVFLEKFDETLTVRDMRDKLRSTGAIGQSERPKLVPLTHYLLYKYNADWKKLIDEGRQGGNKEELAKAERLLAETKAAFQESEAKASAARIALAEAQNTEAAAVNRENEAKAREADAVAREEEARTAEAPFKAAQEEVASALAEVHKQEAEYNGKIADAEKRSQEGGVVQRNKAAAELAQLKAEDPLPLRKAKITLEAAEKRAAKARAPFEAATAVAVEARNAASAARKEASAAREAASQAAQASARAKQAAEAALEAAAASLGEAEAYLQEVKSKPGASYGALWWIDRELYEQKKYLPTSRGGISK